jgi:hypothetical protein
VGLVPRRGCLLTLAYYAFPRWYEFEERRWNDVLTGENWRTRRKTCLSATLSTTNPTWIVPGANPGLRGEKPATNDLSHGPALCILSNIQPRISLRVTFKRQSNVLQSGKGWPWSNLCAVKRLKPAWRYCPLVYCFMELTFDVFLYALGSCFVYGRSNLGPETSYPDWLLSWFPSVPTGEFRDSALKLGHNRFVSNPVPFVIHVLPLHLTLYIYIYWKSVVK